MSRTATRRPIIAFASLTLVVGACATASSPGDERLSRGEYRDRFERQPAPPCSTQPAAPLVQGVDSLDRLATLLPSAKSPSVPASLLDTGTTGFARVTMVLEPDGRVRPGSAVVLETSHDDWGRAVLFETSAMRFYPAERGGCAVAVRSEQPFAFRINAANRRPPPQP